MKRPSDASATTTDCGNRSFHGSGTVGTLKHATKSYRSPLLLRKVEDSASGQKSLGQLMMNHPLPIKLIQPSELGPHPDPDDETESANVSSLLPSRSSFEGGLDEIDVGAMQGTPDVNRTRQAIEHLAIKINRTKDLIKEEQTARDDNVNEYLKLASNADKQQIPRLKSMFEKRNQKSAQTIGQLQKKLESYQRRQKELEVHGVPTRQPKEVLRDVGYGLKSVGENIKDGITGFSGSVMAKPREFASLIKNKFGSVDNISSFTSYIAEDEGEGEERIHHGSATLPATLHHSSRPLEKEPAHLQSDEGSDCEGSSVTSESGGIPLPGSGPVNLNSALVSSPRYQNTHTGNSSGGLDLIFQELEESREENERIRLEVEKVKNQFQQEVSFLHQALQEERYRVERLEEQVNDLTELHQNEIENLKTGISDMEEKVQYQSEERMRDVLELMESCQTRISRMEHQQQQHQQLVTLEGIENSNARAIVVKLINIILTILQVLLLVVATVVGIVMPFFRTRIRILTTIFMISFLILLIRERENVYTYGHSIVDEYLSRILMR